MKTDGSKKAVHDKFIEYNRRYLQDKIFQKDLSRTLVN